YGERFGFLDRGHDISNLMANLQSSFAISSLTGMLLWLRPLVIFISTLQAASDWMFIPQCADRKISEYSQKTEKEPSGERPTPMIKRFLDALEDKSKGMTEHDITANAAANIGAGGDTAAIGLSAVVFYLYRSPEKLQRLREEIDTHNSEGNASFQELQKLPYLQAVIRESMRVHPGVGFPLFRVVPKGGALICGRFFPEGTNVGVNSWVIHRDQSIWGPDADEFIPERWMTTDAARLKVMEQYLVPFSVGSRTCIGKNISLFEINKLLPQLVRNYDIEIEQENDKDLRAKNMWFVRAYRFKAKINRGELTVGQ
ncbi:cytochrome P450, partial [Aspergillus heteromorphus CBS 117.55]